MTIRQKQETIDSLTEILESRDQFKAEKELLEQNNKLTDELNKLRKREHQLKTQLNGDQQKYASKRRSKLEMSDLSKLLVNLDTKKNVLMKDLEERDVRGRVGSINIDRKLDNKSNIAKYG